MITCLFLYLIFLDIICISEEKVGAAEDKSSSVSTSAENQSGQRNATAGPGAGFPGNPFDFSNMAGLLNVLSFLFLYFFACYFH